MSNIPRVDGVYFTAKHTVLIEAKTASEQTTPHNLRAGAKYTLLCSTLGAGEEIVGEIYDPSRSAWQPWFYAGNRVKLAQNQEQFFFDGASGLVRFVKPVTTTNVGLTIFYA